MAVFQVVGMNGKKNILKKVHPPVPTVRTTPDGEVWHGGITEEEIRAIRTKRELDAFNKAQVMDG